MFFSLHKMLSIFKLGLQFGEVSEVKSQSGMLIYASTISDSLRWHVDHYPWPHTGQNDWMSSNMIRRWVSFFDLPAGARGGSAGWIDDKAAATTTNDRDGE